MIAPNAYEITRLQFTTFSLLLAYELSNAYGQWNGFPWNGGNEVLNGVLGEEI
jgi:hypothetical protein